MAKAPPSQTSIVIKDDAILVTQVLVADHRISIRYHRRSELSENMSISDNLAKTLSALPKPLFKHSLTTFVIPPNQVQIQHVKLPPLKKQDFLTAIDNQIDDRQRYYWSHSLLHTPAGDPTTRHVMIIKVERAFVDALLTVFDTFRIPLTRLVTRSNLIEGELSLIKNPSDSPHQLAIDLDNDFLKIYLLHQGKVTFFRYVPYGFDKLVQSLTRTVTLTTQKEEAITVARARQILQDIDLFSREETTDLPLDHLYFLIRPNLEKIVLEIAKSTAYFSEQIGEDVAHDSVLLTGCFLKIKNAVPYLASALKTTIITPEIQPSAITLPERLKVPHNVLATCVSAALFYKTGNPFNLLPAYYLTRRVKRLIGLVSVLGIVAVFLVNALLMLMVLQNNTTLHTLVEQTRTNVKLIGLKHKLVARQNQLTAQDVQAIHFVNTTQQATIPVNAFLYTLSDIAVAGMRLDQIIIDAAFIRLHGSIVQSQSQMLLISYINKLEQLPYLDEVQFEFGNTSGQVTEFIINGTLTPPPAAGGTP